MLRYRMQVEKYVPSGLYGFVEDGTRRAFFHQGSFQPGDWPDNEHSATLAECAECSLCLGVLHPAPPISGEEVDVEFPEDTDFDAGSEGQGDAPRAEAVERIVAPKLVWGRVDVFHPNRGYGFITGDDGVSYYLHRSEVLERRMPLEGHRAVYYAGVRKDKPRACHVRICSKVRP